MEIKAYLFRIASNTWIDSLRKARVRIDGLDEVDREPSAPNVPTAAETEEAMAALLRLLPPRQRVIYLLIDTLGFSPDEIASMIGTTTGAVKAALQRARATLASRAGTTRVVAADVARTPLDECDRDVLQRFVAAFNRRDADALVALLDEGASTDIVGIAEELGRDVIRTKSMAEGLADPANALAELGVLAGEQTVFIYTTQEDGARSLRWMIRLQMTGGKICRWSAYFVTPELIRHAAKVLGVPASQSDTLNSFRRTHDGYLSAWREGLARGDSTAIEPYYRNLRSVHFARPGWDSLQQVAPSESIAGLKQTVSALSGWRHVVADRTTLVRNDHEIIVFFRKIIANGEREYAAFMLQVWLDVKENGSSWTLIRETVEK